MILQVLMIDEVSMTSGEMFQHLEQLCRLVREVKEPFGGLQIVLCGDFFQ
jgi:ATP-dependent DNA helicase PIF1